MRVGDGRKWPQEGEINMGVEVNVCGCVWRGMAGLARSGRAGRPTHLPPTAPHPVQGRGEVLIIRTPHPVVTSPKVRAEDWGNGLKVP